MKLWQKLTLTSALIGIPYAMLDAFTRKLAFPYQGHTLTMIHVFLVIIFTFTSSFALHSKRKWLKWLLLLAPFIIFGAIWSYVISTCDELNCLLLVFIGVILILYIIITAVALLVYYLSKHISSRWLVLIWAILAFTIIHIIPALFYGRSLLFF